jgi:hypothetical protein
MGSSQAEESPNYCLDPQANSEWATLLSKNPNDDIVARLFALRIGLCELVSRKIITLDRATDIFEPERDKAVRERKQETIRKKNKTPQS